VETIVEKPQKDVGDEDQGHQNHAQGDDFFLDETEQAIQPMQGGGSRGFCFQAFPLSGGEAKTLPEGQGSIGDRQMQIGRALAGEL